MQEISFYQNHLDQVSRSFAFCIKKLDSPFRQWISLSYLLCRVLDTIEDSPWEDVSLRNSQYAEFESFLNQAPSPAVVSAWSAKFPKAIPESEKGLLNQAFILFDDLHGLTEQVRQDIRETVTCMSAGMRHYASNHAQNKTLRLETLAEVNRYCYFVAGIVGELLTRLFSEYRTDFKPGPEIWKNAFHFGLFLQKVNLLKDQRSDEREGRYLVPDRTVVLSSLRENAVGAIDYITSLPQDEKGYRVFCAWSLFLGAASLPFIEQSYEQDDKSKIPRSVTEQLLAAIEEIAQDNSALRSGMEEYLPLLPHYTPENIISPMSTDWFKKISGNVLASTDLLELRVL